MDDHILWPGKHVFETISWRNNSKEEKIRGKNRKKEKTIPKNLK